MSTRDDDAEIIAAARLGFLDEADDMLRQFEHALLELETSPQDSEILNAAFRAAHTIKGTAGLFGCDAVVSFTHEVETLLEALRSGRQAMTPDIGAALLEGRDQIDALMAEVRSGAASPEVARRSATLGERLRALLAAPAGISGAPALAPAATSSNLAAGPAERTASTEGCWHLSLRFGTDALRNGLDPMAFLRYLGTMGHVVAIHTLADEVPAIESIDAESCHLGFELRLRSDQPRCEIERVFEFAMDDCTLEILAPDALPAEFDELLAMRAGSEAAARSRLLGAWRAIGVGLPLRTHGRMATPADPMAGAVPSDAPSVAANPAALTPGAQTPLIERRDDGADRRAGTADRRAPPSDDAALVPLIERRKGGSERRGTGVDRRTAPGEESARFVKVRADKLDQLIDLIGELVIAGSGAQMAAAQNGSPLFLEAAQRVCDLVQATRDGALALRMVPVGETFSRFQRVVRDTSRQLGKEIELVVTGGDTELDKSMVDVIADPLMHLVRNSLDHGIETPAERTAAGKPATGRLGLNAYHEGGTIVIEVSDDGRGLRRDRILAKAVERGLVSADATLTDPEVWQLIFAPGFSTADKLTDLSGRGVGMDVVKRNIESLRGHISLASHEGHGTTTQIRLPLTLAMIDGFLTLVGGVHYVLPLAVVSECIDLPPECKAAAGPAALAAPGLDNCHRPTTCGTFDLRGEVLPWLDLAAFYGMPPADVRRRSLIVVREGPVRMGLVVDRLLGEHQTVIKPLAGIFAHLKALAGSTILGSGDVALVLDMQGLMDAATRHAAPATPAATPASARRRGAAR